MKQPFAQRAPVVWTGAIFCTALWGAAFPAIKTGYSLFRIAADDAASQIQFAGVRFFLAGLLALLFGSLVHGRFLVPKKSSWKNIVILALLQTVLQYFFFYIGLAHASGVNSSLIQSTNVFMALLVAALVFRQEKLTTRKLFGVLVGFAGVALVNCSGGGFRMSMTWNGEGFIFLSTVAYAFASVSVKKFSETEDPFTMSSYQFLLGGAVLTAAGSVWKRFGAGSRAADSGAAAVPSAGLSAELRMLRENGTMVKALLLLLLLAFISAAAFSIWSLLLKYNPVSRIAVFGFLTPVFGVVFSILFLHESGEHSAWSLVLSLALIAVGTLLVQGPQGKKKRDL